MDIFLFLIIAGVGYVIVAGLFEWVRRARRRGTARNDASGGRPPGEVHGDIPQYVSCPRPDCRYLNPEHADYCGRCGASLRT